MSKKGDEWGTPDDLFKVLHKEWSFNLDAACKGDNVRRECPHGWFIDRNLDALDRDWLVHGASKPYIAWLNPPYSRGKIGKFMAKAYLESTKGTVVVCLVRDDPSAKWYQNWVDGKATQVRRLKHRVKFKGAKSAYPFPVCVVIYTPEKSSGKVTLDTDYILWDWKDEK